jgi:hypothetical protein
MVAVRFMMEFTALICKRCNVVKTRGRDVGKYQSCRRSNRKLSLWKCAAFHWRRARYERILARLYPNFECSRARVLFLMSRSKNSNA